LEKKLRIRSSIIFIHFRKDLPEKKPFFSKVVYSWICNCLNINLSMYGNDTGNFTFQKKKKKNREMQAVEVR